MKTRRNTIFVAVLFLLVLFSWSLPNFEAFADDGNTQSKYYVYDDYGNLLIERSEIEINDKFLTEDFTEWTIYYIEGNSAFARQEKSYNKPYINIAQSISNQDSNKKICLYMTHNDESYTPSDGYSSIYGAGGIHDVAYDFKSQLESKGITVYIDNTLHIPHDSKAYTRSKVTATKLQNTYSPSGLFDIHRDGVARNVYYSQNENFPFSKIRIVVGKSNPNFQKNYEFAQKIFSIGQALYPGLFLDVYCGNGTYNQNLQEHALLFEMGTYLIEKDLVLNSTPLLANVINTALFNCQSESENEITIDENYIDELENDYNNLTENDENSPKSSNNYQENQQNNDIPWLNPLIIIISVTAFTGAAILLLTKRTAIKK